MKMKKLTNAKNLFLVMTMILGLFAVSAFAIDRRIDMQGSAAAIPRGQTITRSLYRIPTRTAGQIRLRLKWHVVNPIPIFTRLTVRLRHGNRILRTSNCYSYHSNKNPKCILYYTVSQAEARRSGPWNIKITNNSGFMVMGFDVEKGSDVLPAVPNFRSVFRYTPSTSPCTSKTQYLNMQGTPAKVSKGNTLTRNLYGVGKSKGVILVKAKWYSAMSLLTYDPLTVKLIKPNGRTAVTRTAYSYHSPIGRTKMNIRYNVTSADARLSGSWKIRIQNNTRGDIFGFDIEKGRDSSRAVPNFRSTYKNYCS